MEIKPKVKKEKSKLEIEEKSANDFIYNLKKLSNKDRANLKRDLGKTLNEASGGAEIAFYKTLEEGNKNNEGIYFLIATCECFYDRECFFPKREFIECLSLINEQQESDGIEKKLIGLFDISLKDNEEYFVVKLSRLVRFIKQKAYYPDFSKLLLDILHWDSDTKYVQRKWAKNYFNKF